ncbi:MFS transporter [Nocardiopsis rhodophaea]|uniref:MFS transporter n=1 Tax=Nocardiopsis rhodophaea TaxID=280238 RepID=A0ABN2S5Z6_9ACTN
MNRSILVLMFCLFSVGSAEFVIAGLLPGIASELDVSVSAAGMLVSGYAIAIVLAGPAITLLTGRLPRKPLMIALMTLFAVSNAAGALAPDYTTLMVTRVLSAFTHCTFFALALVVGTGLVPADRQGAAIARLAIGLNMANVLGVPLGTLLGTEFGWRSTLWAVSLFGVIASVLLAVLIPGGRQDGPPSGALAELRVLGRSQVVAAIGMSALGCGGVFTAYTFIAPLLEDVSGFGGSAVGVLLLLFGLGTFAGSAIGGKLTDRALMPSLCGLLGAVAVVLATYSLLVTNQWTSAVGLVLFGMSFGAILPGLQARVMRSSGIGAPTLALAVNIAAMNIGIAFGSWLGGRILDTGMGLRTVVLAGAAVAAVGFLLSLLELFRDRTRTTPEPAAEVPSHV